METAAARGIRAEMVAQHPDADHLRTIGTLIDAGQIKPVLNSVLSCSNVREAQDRVQSGHTRGKIVLRMDMDNDQHTH